MVKRTGTARKRRKNNPWEVLVVAALFFFPGLALLFQREPMISFQSSWHGLMASSATGITPQGARIFGVLAIAFAMVMVWFYFRLRTQILRDEDAGIRYRS